jgi:hypothetical protein
MKWHLVSATSLSQRLPFLEHGTHIVVGTPGRIEEHLRKGTLKLNHIKTLVLDEADRMLDMGFQDTIDQISDCALNEVASSFCNKPKPKAAVFPEPVLPCPITSLPDKIIGKLNA